MKMKNSLYWIILIVLLSSFVLSACSPQTAEVQAQNESSPIEQTDTQIVNEEETEEEISRPDGWTEETHDKSADPNYEVVFPQDEVNRIDLTITADTWQAMQENMTALYGEPGDGTSVGLGVGGRNGGRPGAPGGGGMAPPDGKFPPDGMAPPDGMIPPDGMVPPEDGAFPMGNNQQERGGGGPMMSSPDPDYFTTTVSFEGDTWTNVGIRYRGNSTLRASWSNGTAKISFMLDFDEFEDTYPEIDDQRFYGFKKLVFSSNTFDNSLLREKVTADIFRDAGVAAAQSAYYEVYVDYGEGPVYFGLYTALEMVDDTVIDTQFDDNDGNVYKPEGIGATFAEGTFSEDSFEKSTNQEEADWSDIEAVFAAIHADTRLTDPAQWRADLEAVFDVDAFLNWLAVDTLVQNWDTYGVMNHNYYLYTDLTTGLVTWIPWDNNMALSSSVGKGQTKTLDQENIGDNWPLIRYLLDDEVYYQTYVDYVAYILENVFYPERMTEIYQTYHNLIAPYVLAETQGYTQLSSVDLFNQSVDELITHVNSRYAAGQTFVNNQ
ncbi:MAG: spore coat protein [Anaerolineaceae bacterium]|nr:spore coat protein [Anaerolineaceae bacterium]